MEPTSNELQPTPQPVESATTQLEHELNCPAWLDAQGHDCGEACTCGLKWRVAFETERSLHHAWRKRAEECEAKETKEAQPGESAPEPWTAPFFVNEQENSYFIVCDDIAVAEVFGKSEDSRRIACALASALSSDARELYSAAKAVVDYWENGGYEPGIESRLTSAVRRFAASAPSSDARVVELEVRLAVEADAWVSEIGCGATHYVSESAMYATVCELRSLRAALSKESVPA